MYALSEIVFLLHDVGKALVRDVEEVDEGLHVACFQQMRANAFAVVVLMVIARGGVDGGHVLELLVALATRHELFLLSHLVE